MAINAITGYTGVYTPNRVQNASLRYGMNAASNMEEYTKQSVQTAATAPNASCPYYSFTDDEAFVHAIEAFPERLEKDTFTPSNFRYRYSAPNETETVDKMSLLGASYEELGQKEAVSVKKMNQSFASAYPANDPKETGIKGILQKLFERKTVFNAAVLDVNNDKKVSVDEYAAFLTAADIKSKDKNSFDTSLATGEITDDGLKEAFSLLAVNSKNKKEKKLLIDYQRNFFAKIGAALGLDSEKETFKTEIQKLDTIA